MGLAEPRKRLKLSHDPNNTKWTNDTSRFGHKIMTAQGWTPGDYLGAKDAPHAEFHTEANASHIKVLLKDDNLGIGAKKGSGVDTGECVGLDVFQNLLGRLNGRDEDEMAKEQKSREDLKRAIYTERKWGSIRFVSGGFLIGDKIQDLIDAEAERVRALQGGNGSTNENSDESSESESDDEDEATPEPVVKKTKKEKKSKKESKKDKSTKEAEKESKKSKKKRKAEDDSESEEDIPKKKSKKSKDGETKEERRKRRDEKRARKAEKKAKKAAKKAKKSKKDSSSDSSSSESDAKDTVPAANRPIVLGGHQAVRARWIAQKRAAAADPVALSQIFMIKSQ